MQIASQKIILFLQYHQLRLLFVKMLEHLIHAYSDQYFYSIYHGLS